MIAQFIDDLIEREGGYVDHPLDRGGPTNMGITLRTLKEYRRTDVTEEDVANLELEEARLIYYMLYWFNPRLNILTDNPVLQELLLDTVVLHGKHAGIRMLQNQVGTYADGVIGPITQAAVESMDPVELAGAIAAARVMFIARLIKKNPSQVAFIEGWYDRLCYFINKVAQARAEEN